MRRRVGKGLAAALLGPVLVLAVSAPLYAMTCRMGGATMTGCCCPAPDGTRPVAATTVGRETCCQLEQHEAAQPDSELPAKVRLDAPTAAGILDSPGAGDRLVPPGAAISAGGSPPIGPPLLLAKSVLLI